MNIYVRAFYHLWRRRSIDNIVLCLLDDERTRIVGWGSNAFFFFLLFRGEFGKTAHDSCVFSLLNFSPFFPILFLNFCRLRSSLSAETYIHFFF